MGYTHYWEQEQEAPKAAWAALVRDAKAIIKAAEVPLADWDGTGKPKLDDAEIRLNGVDEDSCESLNMSPRAAQFEFCKTNYRPYDLIVCAILLRAAVHLPGFKFSSDGAWESESWVAARKLVAQMFEWAPENSQFSRN